MTVQLPGDNETNQKALIRAIRSLAQGRSNATGTFTLAAGATSTTVQDANCAVGSVILLMSTTADAAAALPSTFIPPATVQNGSFVIQHANNSQTDRTFAYGILG